MKQCPYLWGSHGCDLANGHEGHHECRLGHELEGGPDTRPRKHPQVWRWGVGSAEVYERDES